MAKQKAASTDLGRLTAFVGEWKTKGEIKNSPSGQPVKFKAKDHYEWLQGGHFLLHRFDADMPEGNIKGIEIIGYNPETASYFMHSFDSQGNATVMQGRMEGDTWKFVGERARFTGSFDDQERILAGVWELRSADGSGWEPWMDVKLRKTE
jgi:hypothetical protein